MIFTQYSWRFSLFRLNVFADINSQSLRISCEKCNSTVPRSKELPGRKSCWKKNENNFSGQPESRCVAVQMHCMEKNKVKMLCYVSFKKPRKLVAIIGHGMWKRPFLPIHLLRGKKLYWQFVMLSESQCCGIGPYFPDPSLHTLIQSALDYFDGSGINFRSDPNHSIF